MKNEFILAIKQLAAEKNLSEEVILAAVESALASAFRKNNFAPNQVITVKINRDTGAPEVMAEMKVVDEVIDDRCEISLKDARKIDKECELDDLIMVKTVPQNAGRIAAQTAKQVLLQRLHEAEHSAIFDEYSGKAGDIVPGTVRRIDSKQITIDLGRAEGILPVEEQVPGERYRIGQRIRAYLVEVAQSPKGSVLILSRSHPNLLRRLLELEVPEIHNGTVEIKSIAREAGYRSKVAVVAKQEGVDAVGCCVGLRGIRIQNIVTELGNEKIDVVNWSPEPALFIAQALSPAQVATVKIDEKKQSAIAVIPDKMLSLAIGKEGQNVRLAVKLTGWKIDIKSVSDEEADQAQAAVEDVVEDAPVVVDIPEKPEKKETKKEETVVSEPVKAAPAKSSQPQGIRFAEDILMPMDDSSKDDSGKKKKKKKSGKENAEDGIRLKRQRRGGMSYLDQDEDDF
jgi:N utilization substance protein A